MAGFEPANVCKLDAVGYGRARCFAKMNDTIGNRASRASVDNIFLMLYPIKLRSAMGGPGGLEPPIFRYQVFVCSGRWARRPIVSFKKFFGCQRDARASSAVQV